jgi:hypothetical protein
MLGRPKDPVWEHGDNLAPGWRCNYCGMQKSGGGPTRFKQHLAARESSVLLCSRVPPPVREYFQRDIERTKKATTDGARERVAQRRRQKRETIQLVDMMRGSDPGCN